jgi:hypothetical protein
MTKYLVYAFGEIVLVVVGILIAVQINNFNEKRASKRHLASCLKIYKKDLEIDTLRAGQVLKTLNDRKEYFKIFLSDTITAYSFKKNPQGYGLFLSYAPFKVQQKGIRLLEAYVDDEEFVEDTLVSNMLAQHRIFDNLLDASVHRISEDIDSNMNYFKEEKAWIADLLLGKIDDQDLMNYFLSENYRARLAIHSNLVFGNLEQQLILLQNFNKESILKLEKRLN